MHKLTVLGLGLLAGGAAHAASLDLDIELPRIDVADYRRPYVAVWIERPDHTVAANLAVRYDVKMRDAEGTKWLKDLRQWWRRTGRELSVPVDGLTSATRNPGRHRLSFTEDKLLTGPLPAGEYRLQIEAVREHGGRELITVPLSWPPTTSVHYEVQGQRELGQLTLTLTP